MEHAFILPIPKSIRTPETELIESDPHKSAKLHLFEIALEKLRKGKMKWEEFLQKITLTDPILRLAATKEADSILHLIALDNRGDLVDLFAKDQGLLFRRNLYGLTPLEIAEFLGHKQIVERLRPGRALSFSGQPHLIIDESAKEMLSSLGFLSQPIFEKGEDLYDILVRSQRAKKEDLISSEKIWMGIYFDKEIQEGLHPLVSIQHIDKEIGFGVFAEQRIPSCSYVGEYTGYIREKKPEDIKSLAYCVRYTVWDMGRKNFTIDAQHGGNFTRFINHSSRPNLSLQSVYWRGLPRMIFVALKEIPEGSQLTFDYGSHFWKEIGKFPKPIF